MQLFLIYISEQATEIMTCTTSGVVSNPFNNNNATSGQGEEMKRWGREEEGFGGRSPQHCSLLFIYIVWEDLFFPTLQPLANLDHF